MDSSLNPIAGQRRFGLIVVVDSSQIETPTHHGRRQLLGSGLALALGLLLEACGASTAQKGGSTAAGAGANSGKSAPTSKADSGSVGSPIVLPKTTLKELATQQSGVDIFDAFEEAAAAHSGSIIGNAGPVTAFVPTTEALSTGLHGLVAAHHLPMTPDQLVRLAKGHIVKGAFTVTNLSKSDGVTLSTAAGQNLVVSSGAGSVKVGAATIVVPDLLFKGGVVHLVDPLLVDSSLANSVNGYVPPTGTIGEVLAKQNDLAMSAAIMTAPAFQGMLDAQPVTAFVPNDEALSALLATWVAGTVPTDINGFGLMELVTGHIVGGSQDISALTALNGQSLMTLAGTQVKVATAGDKVQIGGVTILRSIAGANGVLHVVGKVLGAPT